jgi:hypothetical protein
MNADRRAGDWQADAEPVGQVLEQRPVRRDDDADQEKGCGDGRDRGPRKDDASGRYGSIAWR